MMDIVDDDDDGWLVSDVIDNNKWLDERTKHMDVHEFGNVSCAVRRLICNGFSNGCTLLGNDRSLLLCRLAVTHGTNQILEWQVRHLFESGGLWVVKKKFVWSLRGLCDCLIDVVGVAACFCCCSDLFLGSGKLCYSALEKFRYSPHPFKVLGSACL